MKALDLTRTWLNSSFSWKVLLIGGHSGAGKSLVARQLAARWGVGLAEVDDFRLFLERMTTPEQQPALHFLLKAHNNPALTPHELCQSLIAVAETMSYALEIVIANHVATNAPLILEGDGILPAFAAQEVFANLEVKGQVRSVFLVEENETHLLTNAIQRGRSFEKFTPANQQRQVRLSWLYGQWLKQEAQRYALPVIAPHPWNTLAERIIDAL